MPTVKLRRCVLHGPPRDWEDAESPEEFKNNLVVEIEGLHYRVARFEIDGHWDPFKLSFEQAPKRWFLYPEPEIHIPAEAHAVIAAENARIRAWRQLETPVPVSARWEISAEVRLRLDDQGHNVPRVVFECSGDLRCETCGEESGLVVWIDEAEFTPRRLKARLEANLRSRAKALCGHLAPLARPQPKELRGVKALEILAGEG
jgi:hypothetical protein